MRKLKLKSQSTSKVRSQSAPRSSAKSALKRRKFEPKRPPNGVLRLKHQQFVERLVMGSTHLAAYQALYPKASAASAESLAWRLLQRPEVQAELAQLRQKAKDASILTLTEKRQYLAAVLCGSADELPHGSNLVQSVTVTETRTTRRTTRRMPDKLRAIYLDCRLAGEILPAPPRHAPTPPEENKELATDPAAIALLRTITHQDKAPPSPSPSAPVKPQSKTKGKPKTQTKLAATPAPTASPPPPDPAPSVPLDPAPPHARIAPTPNPEPPNSTTQGPNQNLHKTCAEKSLTTQLTDSQILYLQHHQPQPVRATLAANWSYK